MGEAVGVTVGEAVDESGDVAFVGGTVGETVGEVGEAAFVGVTVRETVAVAVPLLL